MAAWLKEFHQGVEYFRGARYDHALKSFDKAIQRGANTVQVFDSRAATYEKLGKLLEALADGRKCITIDGTAVQGYARCARLMSKLRKYDNALALIKTALAKIHPNDEKKRGTMQQLESQVLAEKAAALSRASKTRCHCANLPTELLLEIFKLVTVRVGNQVVTTHLTISHVSKQWRSIVFTNPVFWTELVLSHIKPRQKAAKWKERSHGRIKSLTLLDTLPEEACKNALDTLGNSAREHVQVLKFHSRHQIILKDRIGILLCPDHLKDVEVTGIKDSDPTTQVNLADFVCQKPPETTVERLVLRHLNIVKTPIPPFMMSSILSLTELSLEGCSIPPPPILAYVLDMQVNIKRLSLIKCPAHFHLAQLELWEGRKTQDQLEYLYVEGPYHVAWLLSHFLFPGLIDVTLISLVDQVQTVLQGLQLLEIYQKMERIKVSKCSFISADLILYLSKMDNLDSLEISESGGDINVIVDAIAATTGPRLVCPKTGHFNFSGCEKLSGEPCVRLVRNRLAVKQEQSERSKNFAGVKTLLIDKVPNLDGKLVEGLRLNVPVFSAVVPSEDKKRRSSRR